MFQNIADVHNVFIIPLNAHSSNSKFNVPESFSQDFLVLIFQEAFQRDFSNYFLKVYYKLVVFIYNFFGCLILEGIFQSSYDF